MRCHWTTLRSVVGCGTFLRTFLFFEAERVSQSRVESQVSKVFRDSTRADRKLAVFLLFRARTMTTATTEVEQERRSGTERRMVDDTIQREEGSISKKKLCTHTRSTGGWSDHLLLPISLSDHPRLNELRKSGSAGHFFSRSQHSPAHTIGSIDTYSNHTSASSAK